MLEGAFVEPEEELRKGLVEDFRSVEIRREWRRGRKESLVWQRWQGRWR